MSSQSVVPKKKRGPAPTGQGTQIQVRLQPDLLYVLDSFILTKLTDASRPEALRHAFKEWAEQRSVDPTAGSGGFALEAMKAIERDQKVTAAIEKFASEQSPPLSRAEAVRLLVTEQLIGLGLLPHREDPEGAN